MCFLDFSYGSDLGFRPIYVLIMINFEMCARRLTSRFPILVLILFVLLSVFFLALSECSAAETSMTCLRLRLRLLINV